jgi:ArsR family transcriptional regulator, arsenate/arsenite/antimonite-responsive transcriptional repressor / arsenate reductase (thioredoxin)
MTLPLTSDTAMEDAALAILKVLADDTRWKLINVLRHSDHQAGELAEQCALPQNLVSYHLGLLRQAGLVQAHRSDADARVFYYGLDLVALQQVYHQIGAALPLPVGAPKTLPSTTVVFLCTHNSARSQMAEGWLRQLSGGQVAARSAGVDPTALDPLAARVMGEAGVDIGYQQAKGVDAVRAEQPSVVVTVCDRARETCSSCLDAPVQLHWSIPDPVRKAQDLSDPLDAYRTARDALRVRVAGLLGEMEALIQAETRSS